ncbi:MAG: hypothetical protein PWP28_686 [Oceanotoga sp.]|jgi:hypothetical protein|uniref:Uncharacterized protein n=1 Tax=Oceanotoga teriensis TaxID=515440 RepID=A0AA45HHP4_9BACT|nr:hypothetical protein [Oceanotoga sp.]PWJ86058.1 hypothetical protein C7380_13211 [Oceanotoga teriensis]
MLKRNRVESYSELINKIDKEEMKHVFEEMLRRI